MSQSSTNLSVEMHNVCKTYDHFFLKNFCLKLPKGEIIGIVGPNGAGKSTCLRLLLGFVQADAGRIQVLGHSVPQHIVQIKHEAAYVSEDLR